MNRAQRLMYGLQALQERRRSLVAELLHLDEEIGARVTNLVRELERFDLSSPPTNQTSDQPTPGDREHGTHSNENFEDARDADSGSDSGPDYVEGDKIRVTIEDRFLGRTGTVVGPHETRANFWWIKLDRLPGERKAPKIYKASSSLRHV